MSLALYRAFTTLAAPLVRLYLSRRRRAGKEDAVRFTERFGIASAARPPGALVWLHAASVGESLSILSLIERLRRDRPAVALLVTTGTVTSARIMAERLPAGVVHQYLPVDHMVWVRRFLDHWRPDLVLWVESEFWPNLLSEIVTRSIPAVLVNARISPTSFTHWRRVPELIRRLLATFAFCLPQTAEDRDKLLALGARDVRAPGNLKFAAEALPVDADALAQMSNVVAQRPRWLAASTHPGEEAVIGNVHLRLRAGHADLLTIIVPRHTTRAQAIAAELRECGLSVALRSEDTEPDAGTEIYLADTMGELGLFYRLAPVVFMGGSLVPHGGQNLLEAAKLGCAVIHGPHMTNFRTIAREMRSAGATVVVHDAGEIAAEIEALLADDARTKARARAAGLVAAAKHGILDDVMAELAPCLDAVTPEEAARTGAAAVRHART